MSERPTTGEALIELLAGYGIDTAFGVPGVHNLELYRGLQGGRLRHVLPRHEQGAGFMADGFARASGRPAACFVITGPGLTNIATALGQAFSDSVPMLVVATALDRADLGLGRGRLHEIARQREVAAPLTGFAATALAPEAVPELVGRAMAGFRSGRPRPACIEIPLDVMAAPATGNWRPMALPGPPSPPDDDVRRAAALLREAARPAVILGGGALGLGDRARALVERLAAPVVTTVAAKGLVPPEHPLHLGASLASPKVRAFLADRDLLLVLGSELAETDLWCDRLSPSGRLVRVDLDPARLADARHPAELAVCGDAVAFVEALLPLLPQRTGAEGVGALRERALTEGGDLAARHRRVLDVVRRTAPPETVFTSDMTQLAYTANAVFPVPAPRRWLHPVGFGTLGWALPAAIGAALARPGTPVVAIVGDYGFQYTLAELATAVELALPLVVLLWDNDALGQIRDEMVGRSMQPVATRLRNPDFPALARAMGARVATPRSLDELESALAAALATGGVHLLHLREEDFRG